MTSRMAEAYAGRFDALAVHSASWAWCSSGACVVPDAEDMPDDHPPTAFLHGDQDAIVPVQTMHDYRDELQMAGVATKTDVDSEIGHAWLESAPGTIVGWFERH
jgi:predicted esterase